MRATRPECDGGPQNRWEPAKPVGDTFGARTAEQQNKSTLFRRLWTNLSPFCNTSFLPVAPSEIAPRSKHAQAMERGIPVPDYGGLGNFSLGTGQTDLLHLAVTARLSPGKQVRQRAASARPERFHRLRRGRRHLSLQRGSPRSEHS